MKSLPAGRSAVDRTHAAFTAPAFIVPSPERSREPPATPATSSRDHAGGFDSDATSAQQRRRRKKPQRTWFARWRKADEIEHTRPRMCHAEGNSSAAPRTEQQRLETVGSEPRARALDGQSPGKMGRSTATSRLRRTSCSSCCDSSPFGGIYLQYVDYYK